MTFLRAAGSWVFFSITTTLAVLAYLVRAKAVSVEGILTPIINGYIGLAESVFSWIPHFKLWVLPPFEISHFDSLILTTLSITILSADSALASAMGRDQSPDIARWIYRSAYLSTLFLIAMFGVGLGFLPGDIQATPSLAIIFLAAAFVTMLMLVMVTGGRASQIVDINPLRIFIAYLANFLGAAIIIYGLYQSGLVTLLDFISNS